MYFFHEKIVLAICINIEETNKQKEQEDYTTISSSLTDELTIPIISLSIWLSIIPFSLSLTYKSIKLQIIIKTVHKLRK